MLALTLWACFVGTMEWSGALATVEADLGALTAFACAVAGLAYAVDAELRSALERRRGGALVAGIAAALASCWNPIAMLAFAPAAVACGLALAAPGRGRVSSAPATSPGARPDAL